MKKKRVGRMSVLELVSNVQKWNCFFLIRQVKHYGSRLTNQSTISVVPSLLLFVGSFSFCFTCVPSVCRHLPVERATWTCFLFIVLSLRFVLFDSWSHLFYLFCPLVQPLRHTNYTLCLYLLILRAILLLNRMSCVRFFYLQSVDIFFRSMSFFILAKTTFFYKETALRKCGLWKNLCISFNSIDLCFYFSLTNATKCQVFTISMIEMTGRYNLIYYAIS